MWLRPLFVFVFDEVLCMRCEQYTHKYSTHRVAQHDHIHHANTRGSRAGRLRIAHHTEIFELCENSSKQHCPDCNAYWEIGLIYRSCGRNITEFDQNNRDVTSIPGYVMKKNSSRGAKHGPSERQRMLLPGETDAEKGPSAKARTPSCNTFKMVRP